MNVSIPAMRAACLDKRGMESKKMGARGGRGACKGGQGVCGAVDLGWGLSIKLRGGWGCLGAIW